MNGSYRLCQTRSRLHTPTVEHGYNETDHIGRVWRIQEELLSISGMQDIVLGVSMSDVTHLLLSSIERSFNLDVVHILQETFGKKETKRKNESN